MHPFALAGGVAGGIFLVDSTSSPAAGAIEKQYAGDAIAAAMDRLRAKGSIAGVSYQVDPNNDAIATLLAFRRSAVAKYGPINQDGSGASLITPAGLAASELVDLMTAWLAAYDVGRMKNEVNFGLTTNGVAGAASTCSSTSSSDRTSIGNAACELSAYRDQIEGMTNVQDVDGVTVQTFSLVNALASEMDGADFTTVGVRATDKQWSLDDVPGAIGAAGAATAGFVAGIAGDAVGAVAGAIVGSPLFWAVGLGIVAWMVLR